MIASSDDEEEEEQEAGEEIEGTVEGREGEEEGEEDANAAIERFLQWATKVPVAWNSIYSKEAADKGERIKYLTNFSCLESQFWFVDQRTFFFTNH